MFTSAREANLFIGRHLLNNRFDFEAFTDDNLERECFEEVCNYEEAREFFEDPDKTVAVQIAYNIVREVTGSITLLLCTNYCNISYCTQIL